LPAPVEEDLSKGIQPGSRTSFLTGSRTTRANLTESASTSAAAAAELQRQRTALAAGARAGAGLGANFSVQKAVFASLGPGGFLFARYLIMPACAVLLLWQRYGTRWPKVSRRERWRWCGSASWPPAARRW